MKPSASLNIIKQYIKKASEIERRKNAYNYKYTYWAATPNGMVLDTEKNHKYGSTRDGYECWKNEAPREYNVSHGGAVSLRSVHDRTQDNLIVAYITEEKLSDNSWLKEFEVIADECFIKLCELLEVKDIENFKFFIFSDLGLFKDSKMHMQAKLDKMYELYEEYQFDEDYKALIDKIKS